MGIKESEKQLIKKYLDSRMTSRELMEFDELYEDNAEFKKYFELMELENKAEESYQELIEYEKSKEKQEPKIISFPRRLVSRVAIFLLLIMAGLGGFLIKSQTDYALIQDSYNKISKRGIEAKRTAGGKIKNIEEELRDTNKERMIDSLKNKEAPESRDLYLLARSYYGINNFQKADSTFNKLLSEYENASGDYGFLTWYHLSAKIMQYDYEKKIDFLNLLIEDDKDTLKELQIETCSDFIKEEAIQLLDNLEDKSFFRKIGRWLSF